MTRQTVFSVVVLLIGLVISASGCYQATVENTAPHDTEDVIDTGILVIKSSPPSAQVYINGQIKGDTPMELYNFPIGSYDLVIRKEGYVDGKKSATVSAGKTQEVSAVLMPVPTSVEENKPLLEGEKKNVSQAQPILNKINLSSFAMYYYFDNNSFTELRTEKSELLSMKYESYIQFIAIAPSRIKIVNKQINAVKKDDCVPADDGAALLYSGQTLCFRNANGSIVVISGKWTKIPEELEWVLLS